MDMLKGIRVVDMTQFLSASYCTQILGDLGADVIKIEQPGKGEVYRSYGPKFINGQSTSYLALNRNKRSLALNIKDERCRRILKKLIATSDVLVENFRVGTLKKYGLDYESVREINPRLVYCSVSGFGQTGPYSEKGGFDLIAQSMSGIMYVTGEKDGPPLKVGYPVTDIGAGLYGALGVMSALIGRQRTNSGCHLDTSLFEVGSAWSMIAALNYFADGSVQGRMGSASTQNAPYQAFTVSDGAFTVGTGNDVLWVRFLEVFGIRELSERPEYLTNALRVENQDKLSREIQEAIKDLSVDDCIRRLDGAGIPCGVINSVENMLHDKHIGERGMLIDIDHPDAGHIKNLAFPMHFDGEVCTARLYPPRLGEHTRSILGELGCGEDEIRELIDSGAAGALE